MSERMTNVEIEDILSSIRRLVAEEARPPLQRQPPKLVLTAADRVPPARPVPDPQPEAPVAAAAEDALEARIAELEALLGMPQGPFEADEGDPFDTPPALRHPAAPDPAPSRPRPPVLELVASTAPQAPEAPAAAPLVLTPAADEPPDSDPAAAQPAAVDTEAAAAEPAAIPEPLTDSAAEPAGPAADRDADRWEAAEPGAYFAPAPDDDVIDEETLRDIVRDILREELQGPLGERITRNLRKLVRAEIARAMVSREL